MKKSLLLSAFFLLCALGYNHAQVTPTVFAEGFNSGLIGLNFDAEGNLWATQNGSGNDDGSITLVDPAGNKTVFMTGLPSTYIQAAGEIVGSYRTYQRPNNKVLIVVGEGSNALSETLLTVDKSAFSPGTPLTLADVEEVIYHGDFMHAQGFVQSNPFNVTWDADGHMYIADSGANSIVKWDRNTGDLSILATLDRFPNPLPFGPPMIDPVPTKVMAKPDGGFYVSQLTGFPFIPGAANVYNLDPAGNLSVHASGFTCLTDMGFDPTDGNLCVMQFGVFGQVDSTLNFILGSAAVIKLRPDGSRDTIAQGIGGLAPAFTFDAAGNLYVADLVFGQILKYEFTPSSSTEAPLVQTAVSVYPNPSAQQVHLTYELQHPSEVTVGIYDLHGKQVAAFQPGNQAAGSHTLVWDQAGAQPSGHYIYRLVAGRALASGLIQIIK